MGIVAHPGNITSLAVSSDGKYLFSAGGSDLSVNMWKIEPAFESPAAPEGASGSTDALLLSADGDMPPHRMPSSPEMAPFFSLLEGGEGGDLHNDIIDYFYYCQLRHLGEDTMDPRDLKGNPIETTVFRMIVQHSHGPHWRLISMQTLIRLSFFTLCVMIIFYLCFIYGYLR